MPLSVAIVGRPNVGKSTLFNRLVGRRLALVDDTPGVTRDWREGEGRLGPLQCRVIDTAGLEEAPAESLEGQMRRQTEQALRHADVALFLVDARNGITPIDRHFADWLRRQPTPVILVANKAEGRLGEAGAAEAYALGLGDPIALSAAHGEGLDALYEALAPFAGDAEPAEEAEVAERGAPEDTEAVEEEEEGPRGPLRLAVLGRPNAGKSTLINRLVGEERLLTGPQPGVTRDAIAVPWQWQGHEIALYDTAGLRRRARIAEKLEKLSAADAIRAMHFAAVVVLLLDAQAPLERQELLLARRAIDEGRALVVAVNKWDMAADGPALLREIRARLDESLAQARGVPLVAISALTGRGVERLMPAVLTAYERWQRRLPTSTLNRWLEAMTERHPPPLAEGGRRLRLRYMTQLKARPPTFLLFANKPGALPESYMRYLQNGLRDSFDLAGVPIRLQLRKGRNPYVSS